MATINFYLLRRGKSEKKKIILRYLDKSCKDGKHLFQHSLHFSVNPKNWKHCIDPKSKKEKWIVGKSAEDEEINKSLLDWKSKTSEIRDLLTRKDKYGNKVFPTVEEVEEVFKSSIDSRGELCYNKELLLRKDIKNKIKEVYKLTIEDLTNMYVRRGGKEGDMEENTAFAYLNAVRHFKDFQQKIKQTITLDKLSHECFNKFRDYLVTEEPEGPGMVNNTVKLNLSKLKGVITFYQKDYPHMDLGFLDGRYPNTATDTIFTLYEELEELKQVDFKKLILEDYIARFYNAPRNGESYWTLEELSCIMGITSRTVINNTWRFDLPCETINRRVRFDKEKIIKWVIDNEWCFNRKNLETRVKAYSRSRDWYCFASEAPLRHSDLLIINPKTDIVETRGKDSKVIKVVRINPQKTTKYGNLQEFPLTDYALSIIDKYKDEVPENKLLPITKSNGRLNDTLQKMFRLSGLFDNEIVVSKGKGKKIVRESVPRWKELTFHTSRHTFGTNMYARGMDLLKIMKALGHTNISTVQIYTKVIESDFYDSFLRAFEEKPKSKHVQLISNESQNVSSEIKVI